MSEFFSLLSSITVLAVMISYFKQVVKGVSTPNPSTWLIWVIVSAMNMISYFIVVHGDIIKSLITVVTVFCLTLIFIYSLFRGKFGKIGRVEIISFSGALIIGIFWKMTGNAIVSNLLLQLLLLSSFFPTGIGLLRYELLEKSLPWDLAVCAYIFMSIAIILDWKRGDWVALVHPIVNGIIGNGGIALIIHVQEIKFQIPANVYFGKK